MRVFLVLFALHHFFFGWNLPWTNIGFSTKKQGLWIAKSEYSLFHLRPLFQKCGSVWRVPPPHVRLQPQAPSKQKQHNRDKYEYQCRHTWSEHIGCKEYFLCQFL